MDKNTLFTTKSMKHMNPLENLDEYRKVVRPAFWLCIVLIICVVLCVLSWVFLVKVDVASFMV